MMNYIIGTYFVIGLLYAMVSMFQLNEDENVNPSGTEQFISQFAGFLTVILFGLGWPYFIWKFEISSYLESKNNKNKV